MVKVQGVMLRSRVRYEELGEKPTKYFFNFENRQFTNKVMNKIIEENGDEYTNTKDVLNCQKRFYQSKKISNDQELIQSDPISCPQNQKGNN